MEGDLAVERAEGSKPEHAPSSDMKDPVKVEDHACDTLRRRAGYFLDPTTVSMTTLQHYAAQCSACCLLLHAIDANLPGTHREDAQMSVFDVYPSLSFDVYPSLSFDEFSVSGRNADDDSKFCSERFHFFTPSDSSTLRDFPFNILYNVDPITRDTSSNASFVWAERQIAECNQNHNCLSSAQGSPLPSRVLDVSSKDGEKSIRLLTTTNQRERYVCLSHCWGEEASITKTTRQNLKLHTKGIAIDKLPKTFQDAVDITRRLGIDYLWIDSLCIIQDSEDDWEEEASRMADIYEGAYLTIAATSSMNSLEGCYRSYPSSISEKGFLYTTKTGLSSTVYCRPLYRHFGLNVAFPGSSQRFDDFPLLERGWVFQERFLSPRVLHFCNAELVFECRNGARCQCNHEKSDYGFKEDLKRLIVQGPGLEVFQHTKGWWAVVSRYSRLKLTYDRDILTALSGISRRVGASQPTGDYVAGIWKSILPYGLLWYAYRMYPQPLEETVRFKQANAPRAPSWSWASIIAPIDWMLPDHYSFEQPLVNIHDISCEVSGIDAYGRAHGGVLSIRGPILTSNLCWRKRDSGVYANHPFSPHFQFSAIPCETNHDFHPDHPFFASETGPWTVQCLWVMSTIILVLKPLEEHGVFERIGLLQIHESNSKDQDKIYEVRERSVPTTIQII